METAQNVIPMPQAAPAPIAKLQKIMAADNLIGEMDEQKAATLAQTVIEQYDIDVSSRADWKDRIKAAVELSMLVSQEKNYPWKGAANVKYPLLTVAALQFNARAYPAVVQGNQVVKCQTWGNDQQGLKAARAERVSDHMSYQLLSEQPEWEEDTDKLLVMLPIVGSVFRKVYFDPSLGRNVTRLVTADRLVINYRARNIADCPRVTEELYLYPYEIKERILSGRFAEFDYMAAANVEIDEESGIVEQDADAPHLFLEQHRLIDIDGDGYPEPYIVTVHKASQHICRIVANFDEDSVQVDGAGKVTSVRKNEYYVHYQFLPSPDGGFYGWGFGWLLKDITETINSTLSMMMDAGHLANVQGGLVSSQLGLKEKKISIGPGEWKVLNNSGPIAQSVFPITYPGPSAVLFNLLGLLIETGKEVASVKDVLTGEGQGKNASPTTTMALIEQGLQVFTSIYKRVHRSIKAELAILAKLNRKFLTAERYNQFHDGEEQFNPAADYDVRDMDILPVSDPSTVSKMQKMAKAQFLYETAKENPKVNQEEALLRMFKAADIEEPEKLIVPPDEGQQKLAMRGAEAEVGNLEADIAVKMADAQLKGADVSMRAEESLQNAEMEGRKGEAELDKIAVEQDFKAAELDMKERELALKEQELELKWAALDIQAATADAGVEAKANAPIMPEKADHEPDKIAVEREKITQNVELEREKMAHAEKLKKMELSAAKAMKQGVEPAEADGVEVDAKDIVNAIQADKTLDVKYDAEGRIVSAKIVVAKPKKVK